MKIVNFKAPLKELGGSLYIPVRKDLREELHPENPKLITDGLMVAGKLWVVEVKEVNCPSCNNKFTDYEDTDVHDCPQCGSRFKDAEVLEAGENK